MINWIQIYYFFLEMVQHNFELYIFPPRLNITFLYILKIFYYNFINIFNFLRRTGDGINLEKASSYIILIIYFYILPYLDMANLFTNIFQDLIPISSIFLESDHQPQHIFLWNNPP